MTKTTAWQVRTLVLAITILPATNTVLQAAEGEGADDAHFWSLHKQCVDQREARDHAKAEQTALEMLRLAEGPLKSRPKALSVASFQLAGIYSDIGRWKEVEKLLLRSLSIDEEVDGLNHVNTAACLHNLANFYSKRGRYAEAEPLYRRSLKIYEDKYGNNHLKVVPTLNSLACLIDDLGRYEEAEQLHQRALDIRTRTLGEDHPDVARSLNNLASLYFNHEGRHAEAESLHLRALEIRTKALGASHQDVALSLANLAAVYEFQGRYREAETLRLRAMNIRWRILGPNHIDLAYSYHNHGMALQHRGRLGPAEGYLNNALKIFEKWEGPEGPSVAETLKVLASVFEEQAFNGQRPYSDGEELLKRAAAIWEKTYGTQHGSCAAALMGLGTSSTHQERWSEAETYYKKALGIQERISDKNMPVTIQDLGWLYFRTGRHEEAVDYLSRAIALYEARNERLPNRRRTYHLRARANWELGRHTEALADFEKAIAIEEEFCGAIAGGDQGRALALGRSSHLFEKMACCQAELGNMQESFRAIERSRSRTLLDQMALHGSDLLAGLDSDWAEALRRRRQAASTQVAGLQTQLQVLATRGDLSEEQRQQERERLEEELESARTRYVLAREDIRTASPAYALTVSRNRKQVALANVQEMLRDQKAILLEYLVGVEGGHLLVVGPEGPVRLETLEVSEQQAGILGIGAGPLTKKLLGELVNREKGGLTARLRHPDLSSETVSQLAVLWDLLIPADVREGILAGKYDQLIVVPDGSLAKLPFESLIVEGGSEPKYLLDVGPSMQYAPSATVLMNLAKRATEGIKPASEPVLTIGDCRYGKPVEVDPNDVLAQIEPGARYRAMLSGTLPPLPHTANELQWIAGVFKEAEVEVAWLRRELATEASVRYNVPGRRIVHFACHGLVDQAYGNLFGALALTPGTAGDDPADDGFLTLAEIYELNLSGCELAILSACDTNAGPEQRGEGVWALSRGFLVAGARRVVASNWLVDDEAAASLVSYFCGAIAQAEAAGEPVDYAECLHEAKRWVRDHADHPEWSAPYYWAPFVLVGPN